MVLQRELSLAILEGKLNLDKFPDLDPDERKSNLLVWREFVFLSYNNVLELCIFVEINTYEYTTCSIKYSAYFQAGSWYCYGWYGFAGLINRTGLRNKIKSELWTFNI